MKDSIAAYVKRVRDLAEHVKGNEQATKQSLIGPLFTLLGYDLTDPRECIPEYRVDFGKDRSVKPIDWAFLQNGQPIFFVEAKEVGKRLPGYDEQLADYFAKAPEAKLGILTNGVHWRFFTDVVNMNVMDREPFLKWEQRALTTILNDPSASRLGAARRRPRRSRPRRRSWTASLWRSGCSATAALWRTRTTSPTSRCTCRGGFCGYRLPHRPLSSVFTSRCRFSGRGQPRRVCSSGWRRRGGRGSPSTRRPTRRPDVAGGLRVPERIKDRGVPSRHRS